MSYNQVRSPTQEEIQRACRAIQSEWSDKTRLRRLSYGKTKEYVLMRHHLGHVQGIDPSRKRSGSAAEDMT